MFSKKSSLYWKLCMARYCRKMHHKSFSQLFLLEKNVVNKSSSLIDISSQSFHSLPKKGPFMSKSERPLEQFTSSDFLQYLEKNSDLELFLKNEENLRKILNTLWDIVESVSKDPQKSLDPSIVKIIKILFQQKALVYKDFALLEKLFLDSKSLFQLNLNDIQEILVQFTSINEGSRRFYETLSQSFVERFEYPKDMSQFFRVLVLLTEANAYSEIFRTRSINIIQDILEKEDSIQTLSIAQLAPIAFFMALEYEKTHHLHEKFYNVLNLILKERKESFYRTIKKQEHLKYMWTFFQSTQVLDPFLFEKIIKENILTKTPFVSKGVFPSKEHLEIFDDVVRLVGDVKKTAIEKRIGIYFTDIFIEPDLILEVNSFKHYFDVQDRRSGGYEIKYRNLKTMGFQVKEIFVKDWRIVLQEKRKDYIKNIIEN